MKCFSVEGLTEVGDTKEEVHVYLGVIIRDNESHDKYFSFVTLFICNSHTCTAFYVMFYFIVSTQV